MKFFYIILLIFISSAVLADEIHISDNTVRKVTIKNVTADTIEYIASNEGVDKISRSLVDKIVYGGGKEIEFYDRIFINDGTVYKGKIIRKNEGYIEYNPSGPIPYDRIENSAILKIVYDDGRIESFTKSADSDIIYFKNGEVVKGGSVEITAEYVEFYDEKNRKQTYGRSMIEKIVFKDGKTVYMENIIPQKEQKDRKGTAVKKPKKDKTYRYYLEAESGWNGYTGIIGARFDYLFFNNFSINAAAGLGMWGSRYSGAFRYYLEYPYGLAFSLGVSHNLGGTFEYDDQTQDSGGNIYNEKVKYKCKPVTCINGSVLYSFHVNGRNRIYIETGYSYALQKNKYTYTTASGRELSRDSKQTMDVMAPGGFMISAGYAFAF